MIAKRTLRPAVNQKSHRVFLAGIKVHRFNHISIDRFVVPTGEFEMSFYVNRRYAQDSAYVERMVLRPDGFVSVNADYTGGELTTKPLIFDGQSLGKLPSAHESYSCPV